MKVDDKGRRLLLQLLLVSISLKIGYVSSIAPRLINRAELVNIHIWGVRAHIIRLLNWLEILLLFLTHLPSDGEVLLFDFIFVYMERIVPLTLILEVPSPRALIPLIKIVHLVLFLIKSLTIINVFGVDCGLRNRGQNGLLMRFVSVLGCPDGS